MGGAGAQDFARLRKALAGGTCLSWRVLAAFPWPGHPPHEVLNAD